MKYQIDVIGVDFNDQDNFVVLEWKPQATFEQIKVGAAKALELIENNNAEGLLSDERENDEIQLNHGAWLADEWFPKVMQTGIRKYAILVSKARLAGMNPKMHSSKAGSIRIRYFDEEREALRWLR